MSLSWPHPPANSPFDPKTWGDTRNTRVDPNTWANASATVYEQGQLTRFDYVQTDGTPGSFQKQIPGTGWVELKRGQPFANFEEVSRGTNGVVIFDEGRQMYVALTVANQALWCKANGEEWYGIAGVRITSHN